VLWGEYINVEEENGNEVRGERGEWNGAAAETTPYGQMPAS